MNRYTFDAAISVEAKSKDDAEILILDLLGQNDTTILCLWDEGTMPPIDHD